jgi:hypothetical protein
MAELREDWLVLQSLFPSGWEDLARKTGAITRLRGFDSAQDVMRVLLMHVGTGWSLRETAVRAKLAGIADVSDVTLLNRLRQAERWWRDLCQQLWKETGVELSSGVDGHPLRVVDGTVVKEPGKTGSQWRLHYSLRLPSLECDEFLLTPAHGRGGGERLGHFHWRAGELVLADAGYCNPVGVATVVEQGAHVCVKLNPWTLPLLDQHGRTLKLLRKLETVSQPGQSAEWPAWVQAGKRRIAGRVCAIRKSEEAIARAIRKMELKANRGKGTVTPERRKHAHYVTVFTTLTDGAAATAEQMLECYRLRWQIELTFKRLKSIVELGHVPKQNDESSRAWLLGKLFVALLSQKLARVGRATSPWGYLFINKTSAIESVA